MRFCLVAVLTAASVFGAAFRAGVAKADITPLPGEVMWGYENRLTPATGMLDPLYARVFVLEGGGTRLALVTLDLGRPFGPSSLERLRTSAKRNSGIQCLLVTASHSHAGPIVLDDHKGALPAWEESALSKIEAAIQEASAHLVEARLGTGSGAAYIGHNRLRVNPDGTTTWFERNLTKVPTAPVDPTVSVLRVDKADGAPLAILVNYSCHPVVFGPDNLQYSADFPAVMNRTVEAAFEGKAISFFLQGAPGDINPYFAVTPLKEDAVKMREWTGRHLGEEAARVAKQIHTETSPDASIDFVENTLTAKLRWNEQKFREALLRFLGPKGFEVYGAQIKPELKLPVSTVLIGKRIALMTMPGEPFVDFQINWRDRCPVRDAFFLGYANGYLGYFPTIRAASSGGYGAASASTWVEPGAGERMVDNAVVRVYEMLGKLGDIPDDLKRDVYK